MRFDKNKLSEIEIIGEGKYLNKPPGVEHYKLLAYMSTLQAKGEYIADLGTYKGYSALALSYNPEITVYTYDPNDVRQIPEVVNIEFVKDTAQNNIEHIAGASLIFLDVDPHDGQQEREIIRILVEARYTGLVICDDIHLNAGMKDFWAGVTQPKQDITEWGHYSGTGLITL